jgi:hypothetical protein
VEDLNWTTRSNDPLELDAPPITMTLATLAQLSVRLHATRLLVFLGVVLPFWLLRMQARPLESEASRHSQIFSLTHS